MRAVFFSLAFLVSQAFAASSEIVATVHDVDPGSGGEPTLIYLTTGQVLYLPPERESTHPKLQKDVRYRFHIRHKRELLSFQETEPVREVALPPSFLEETLPLFVPSILKDSASANELFQDARKDAVTDSQCYDRAHVWTYEWRKTQQLYTSKIWLFFTRKFIRKYKFDWWFHVAPLVHVIVEGKVRERVMDMKYANGPLRSKQWTDIFMRDDAPCPVVTKYSDQADYPESGSCFLMKSSMYYYQPVDLELLEIDNIARTRWFESEVKHAYREAYHVTL